MGITKEQYDIINFNFPNDEILVVKAYAGTGKSFTLREFCKQKKGATFIYFVYNKSMEKEAKISFKEVDNIIITTFHGLAHRAIGHLYHDRLERKENLSPAHIKNFFVDNNGIYHSEAARKAVYLILDFCNSALTMDDYIEMKSKQPDTDEEEMEALYKIKQIWIKLIDIKEKKLPFEHGMYLKIFQLKKVKFNVDYILVDEAQDINPVMMDIFLNQKQSKRLCCGDDFQQIYSFMGAENSLSYIEKHYNSKTLYLTRSFRCPPHIADIANAIIKRAGAKKDFIGVAEPNKNLKEPRAYIARKNMSIFELCANNTDKRIHYVGGFNSYGFDDIMDMQRLIWKKKDDIKNEKIKSFDSFGELVSYAKKEEDVQLMTTANIIIKHAQKLNDSSGEESRSIPSIIRQLRDNAVPSAKNADMIITTCHKSKGLEWNSVQLLGDFPFSAEGIVSRSKDINIEEEIRLLYVAVTRAKSEVLIPGKILDYFMIPQNTHILAKGLPSMPRSEMMAKKVCRCAFCQTGIVLRREYDSYRCNKCDFSMVGRGIAGFCKNNLGKSLPASGGDAMDHIVTKMIEGNGYFIKSKKFTGTIQFAKDPNKNAKFKYKIATRYSDGGSSGGGGNYRRR